MMTMRCIDIGTGILYWVMQFLGGLMAGAMIYIQVPEDMFVNLKRMNGLGLPKPDSRFIKESIYTEIIASFLFQFAFMSLYLDKRAPKDVHAIATGSMMALAILTIGHVSGGGMNPARVIGPAIISGNLGADLLVFVGGPMAGSYLASFIYKELFMIRISKLKTNV
jgi:glycerol uptake facilitator-like aquaporin